MSRTALAIVFVLLSATPAFPCTTFCVDAPTGPLFGKNYDWDVPDGFLLVNRAGVAKAAMVEDPSPARWVSRYGSVTFNQYGREFPNGGMNTEGLAVDLMWLDGAGYPEPDDRPAVGVLQWIQYQLDTAASVDEVLAGDAAIRIRGTVPLHYLVADRSGKVATVEFLDGRLVAHTGDDLPAPALTNNTYDASVRYLREFDGFGGTRTPRKGTASLDRFVRAAEGARTLDGAASVEQAFAILADAAQGDRTQWSIVYDLGNGIVHFRTRDEREIRSVRLADLSFSCDAPVLGLDLHRPLAGDVTARLAPFEAAANRKLVRTSYEKTAPVLGPVPDDVLEALAAYPAQTGCAGK